MPIHDLDYLPGGKMGHLLRLVPGCLRSPLWRRGRLDQWNAPGAAGAMFQAVSSDQNLLRARAIWKRILPLVHLYTHQLIGPVSDLAVYRSILNFWGMKGGFSRSPFYPLDADQEQRLRNHLASTNWLDPAHALDDLLPCKSA